MLASSELIAALTEVLGGPPQAVIWVSTSFAGPLYRVRTAKGEFALKSAPRDAAGALRAEANGLALLAATGTLRTPRLHALYEPERGPAFLLLEWIAGAALDQSALGAGLAALHRHSAPAYGQDHDNYIGGTPQQNGWLADWPAFFRERRLAPQIALAAQGGHLPDKRRQLLERVLERSDALLAGVARQPALIHGDLWAGNVLATADGAPVLIDPAVYYADREAEIAFTELFGGFGPHFYAAYQAAWPLAPGYTERRTLYTLYHLLNHLNLFGASYGAQVDAAARQIVSRY